MTENKNELTGYQPIPRGMWHMVAAVALMVPTLAFALIFTSNVLSWWLEGRTLQHVELGLMAILILSLSTPTFMLSRGRARCHSFLVNYNLAIAGVLTSGVLVSFFRGENGMALSCLVGLLLALVARYFYRTKTYTQCAEYYRVIWAHHRKK